MSPRRPAARAAGWLLALLLAAGSGRAQTDDPMLFGMSTAVRLAGKDWAYVLWESNAGASLPDEAVAVYARAGGFTAGGTFSRVSVAQRQRDPAAIAWLIGRAEAIGQTAADLSDLLDTVFADLALAPDLTLAQRLAAVVRAADENPEVAENLALLARRHAAIALALGRAAVVPIASSGASTIELRAYDPATDAAGALRSRVGVTANAPRILPAPVSLANATEQSPKSHLVIGLRWGVTDAYKRVSLLGFGFNVYRMTRTFAESHGYHTSPPARADLPGLLATYPALVKRANRLPVLVDEDETPAGKPFFIDDNNRFEPGATPFTDGQQFYYFVTACDVLGRDGDVSAGLLLTARDFQSPLVPIGVQARRLRTYDGAARDFGIEVSWKPNPQTSNDVTSAYYVYRYTNTTDVTFRSTNAVLNRIGGPILQSTNVTRLVFIDTGVGEADIGRYRYYTVRAAEYASGGTNWSGHSAPVACNLRDEDGPGTPAGSLFIDRQHVGIKPEEQPGSITESPLDLGDFRVVCNLPDSDVRSAVRWVEFRGRPAASNSVAPYLIGRYPVAANNEAVTSRLVRVSDKIAWYFWCKALLADGRETPEARSGQFLPLADPMKIRVCYFTATGGVTRVTAGGGVQYMPPGTMSSTNNIPTVAIHLDSDSVEWRVYTQIDDGPLTLMRQGLGEPNTDISGIRGDVERYQHCVWVKYFVQTFDNNGNPSPLKLIDKCYIPGATPAAVEYVDVQTAGTAAAPALSVTWVAEPYGVDHFALYIGAEHTNPVPSWAGSGLSTNLAGAEGITLHWICSDGHDDVVHAGRYETLRVGAGLGSAEGNVFTVTIPVLLNRRYYVQIAAVSRCSEGSPSELKAASWTTPEVPGQITVPWPARPLPEVVDMTGSSIRPVYLDVYDYPKAVARRTVGVVIGRVENNPDVEHTTTEGYLLPTGDDVSAYLYSLAEGTDPLLPFVLYRRQVANGLFPSVSGQYVQVTPLIESFASKLNINYSPPRRALIDPYLVVGKIDPDLSADYDTICVRDRLGVAGGAVYEYYMMRFDSRKEPRDVLKLGTVTIPERPPK
jgi:hypothetical protein